MPTALQTNQEVDTVRGVLPGGIYPACITTFAADEALDTGALRAVIEYQLGAGVDGLVAAGTTGEAHALSFEERRQVFSTAVRTVAGRVPVIGGAGATTTREAFRLVHLAAECGCTAALVLTPWFEHPTPGALLRYFDELLRGAVLPILLYNNPSRTGLDWPPAAIAALAAELGEGIIGIKDSANRVERVREIRSQTPAAFRIFSGGPHERSAFEAAGADGCIDGPANLLAPEAVDAMRGDRRCIEAFGTAYADFERSKNFIALLKASMELAGLPAGVPRRPNDQVDARELAELSQHLKAYGRLAAAGKPRGSAAKPAGVVALGNFQLEANPYRSRVQMLYQPAADESRYNHHPCLARYNGTYFAAWSSGVAQEDSPGQKIRFAVSADGTQWSAPKLAFECAEDTAGRWTAGGLWPRGEQLWLLATRYTRARYVDGARTPDLCWEDLATFAFSWDGAGWRPQGRVIDDFYSNEAPRCVNGDGLWLWPGVNARHDAVVAVSADGAPGSWRTIVLFKRSETVKLTEPSWFVAKDGRIRMLFRDDGGSRRLWLCESRDGLTWSTPEPTDMPDAQAKFHAFALADGRTAIIGNATASELRRRVLTLALSIDGDRFERCIELRNEPETHPRFAGMHKASGFQYPHAMAIPNGILAIYSVNKEDIAVQTIYEDMNYKFSIALLVIVSGAVAGEKGPPPIPMPPLSVPVRPCDGEYGPEKWKWEDVASVQDPVSKETLYIGGRVGGVEFGQIGHWALSEDGKNWRELKSPSALLDPLREKALAARKPAKLGEATARNIYYAALEAGSESTAVKGEPAKLLSDAVKLTGELKAALESAKGAGWEGEGIAHARPRVDKALDLLKSAQNGFASGVVNATLLKQCFDAQWALDEAADCLASAPGPRASPSVAVNPDAKCVVVFGGNHGDYALSDTWIYDCATKAWRQSWPATAPSARFGANFNFDAEKKTLLLSGGNTILNKMVYQQGSMPGAAGEWRFGVKENAWTGTGGVEAGARIYRTIVPAYNPTWYDAAARGERKTTEDWIAKLPANVWTIVPDQPAPAAERDWGRAVFDPDRDQMYRWTGGHCADPANGMSTYHPAINRWSTPYIPEISGKGMSFNGRPDCMNHTYLHYTYDFVSKNLVCTAMGGTGIFNPEIGDFECNIAHPFNRQVYETCTAGTSKGVVVWGHGYFGVLDVKAREWKKLPVKGPLPATQCDGSCLCYDSQHEVLWMTSFLGYQKPSGNIWRYDMKTGVCEALNPANADAICKVKGFNGEIRESVYIPGADIVLYNNLVHGKEVAYDCAKNRWVATNIVAKLETQGTVSDTLMYDAKRGLVWDLNSYKRIYVLKLDPKSLVLSEDPAK